MLWIDCRDISDDFLVSHILQSFCAYFQIDNNNQSSAVIIKTIVNHCEDDSFIVFNDLPQLSNRIPRLNLYWLLLEEMVASGHKLMVTTNFSPPTVIDDHIEYQKENIPALNECDTKEILVSLGANDTFVDTYSNFICSASDGHPIILRAIAKHLKERNWPTENLDLIFRPTNVISKAEIYASIAQSVSSEDSKALLFRLKSVIGNFDQNLINCVAQVVPEIPKPGESFNDLNGFWTQEISPGVYQLSPLIRHLDDNITLEVKQRVMYSLASHVLAKGTITPLEGSKAIFYFQVGGHYDEAAKVLLQVLAGCIGKTDLFFDWGLSVHWLSSHLPSMMSLDLRIRIRCLQISICQEKEEYLNFLITDLQRLIFNASINPELELITHFSLLLGNIKADPLSAMQNLFAIERIAGKVNDEELVNIFPAGVQNIIWISFANCYTEADFLRWFSLIKENPVSAEILDPVNNLSYILSGHVFYNNIISAGGEPDEVTQLLQLILEQANETGITLLAAYALKTIIHHEGIKLKNLEQGLIFYKKYKSLFEHNPIERFIIEIEVATQNFLKEQDAIAIALLKDMDVNVMPSNYRERLDYFLLNVKLYKDIDPEKVLTSAHCAVESFENAEIYGKIEYIKAVGELSLAQIHAGRTHDAFKTISAGYVVLLGEFKMEPEFQAQIIRFGHVILYLTEIIESGVAYSFGEGKANVIPKSGFFHLTNELLLEGGYYSSEKNFAGAVLIQRLYEDLGDEDNSRKWAYTAMEVGLDCELASFASILLKMVFYLITEEEYTKAYNIIAYIQKQYIALNEAKESSLSDSDCELPSTKAILENTLYLRDSPIYFGVLMPAMIKLTLDILTTPLNKTEIEQKLSLIFTTGQFKINDKEQFEQAKQIFKKILLGEISLREFMQTYNFLHGDEKEWIYTIVAIIGVIHADSTDAANMQLGVILKLIPFYRGTFVGFYRFVIVPYLTEIWKLKIVNSPKDFSEYKFLATKGIDAISKKNWDLRIPFIYSVLSNHLNLRMTDEVEKLVFT